MTQPPIIGSRYRVLRELGRGGMGVVYVVEHVHTGDQLALKLLLGDAAKDPQAVGRFKREARASARIKSEHVVRVLDADVAPELEGAPFLVMELLNGTDLDKRLRASGKFRVDEALHYLGQAADALDRSHAAGIVHRDLKPENLFLHTRHDGVTILKILDFGISKLVGEAGNDLASAGATKTGAVMGTPLYMSPEQARGRVGEIGPATDVWAMGLISMQLLTGDIYWRATTIAELMAEILSEPLYEPSTRWTGFPPQVDAWFAKSCARDPRARFPSVGEQMKVLAAAMRGDGALPAARMPDLPGPLASGAALPGARTTTSAVSQEQSHAAPAAGRKGTPFWAIGGVALAATMAVAFAVKSRPLSGGEAAPGRLASEEPKASASPPLVASEPPPATASSLPTSLVAPAASSAPVPSAAPLAAPHRVAHPGIVAHGSPSAPVAVPTPPPEKPPAAPEKKSVPGKYEPTSL